MTTTDDEGPGYALLTTDARAVVRRVLAEEGALRRHVVVYLSGAHAYGFPSPDSDLDLKSIHVAETAELLGLRAPRSTFDRAEITDGVEIDYTSNEIAHALAGILGGNGNFIERVLGDAVMVSSPWLLTLRPLVRASLSRRVARHYHGFATSQLRELDARPTVKRVLYVLRTTLTGAHLLETGDLVTDVTALLDRYGFADARALVTRKLAGERVPLEGPELLHWKQALEGAFARLAEAEARSPLPLDPPPADALDAWLVALRRELWR